MPLPSKQAQSCGIVYPQEFRDSISEGSQDTRLRIFSGTANLPLAQVRPFTVNTVAVELVSFACYFPNIVEPLTIIWVYIHKQG